MSGSESENYYAELERSVALEKSTDRQRTSKKEIHYIQNSEHRRVTYSRRSKSLVILAKELEIQTRCRVKVGITPTWPNGKARHYESQTNESKSQQAVEPCKEAAVTDACAVPPSPVRRKDSSRPQPTIRPTLVQKNHKTTVCRVCGDGEEVSYWLGCGYTNPKTRRQDCTYWVHQNCIGLYYKHPSNMEKVPFFCKRHAPQ